MKKAVLIIVCLSALILCSCGRGTRTELSSADKQESETGTPRNEEAANILGETVEGEELLCLAESETEARETAELYGITLVDFSYGVATFHTEEDPQAVIDRGLSHGWRELSINRRTRLYDSPKP